MTYVFVGRYLVIDGKTLERFGTQIEMDPAVAEPAIARNAPLILKSDFDKIDFGKWTKQDLAELMHMNEDTPAEFHEKRKAAWIALHQFRDSLNKSQPSDDSTKVSAALQSVAHEAEKTTPVEQHESPEVTHVA
jgi:hypothetical protein